ncbi:MAG: DUF2946 family protein [Caldimonas sp.]
MKTTRLWFILLLAVLLPVRGAMAAAMLCPTAGVGTQTEMHLNGGHHGDTETAQPSHAHAGHDHGSSGHEDQDHASTQDKCNVCSAFCSVTPLVSSFSAEFSRREPAPASFPELSTPVLTFLSDGQERPPRSI